MITFSELFTVRFLAVFIGSKFCETFYLLRIYYTKNTSIGCWNPPNVRDGFSLFPAFSYPPHCLIAISCPSPLTSMGNQYTRLSFIIFTSILLRIVSTTVYSCNVFLSTRVYSIFDQIVPSLKMYIYFILAAKFFLYLT